MIKHSFPKLSLALFRKFKQKQYKITPVPSKPFKGFQEYITPSPSMPSWKIKPSHIAMARKKIKYG